MSNRPVLLKKSYLLLLAVSVLLSLTIPVLVGGFGQFRLLQRMPWWSPLPLLLLVFISWGFNAERLCLLVRAMGQEVGFLDSSTIVISAEFAGKATPWAIGMPMAYTFLFKKLELSLSQSMGLFSVMILFDLAFYVTFIPLAAVGLFFLKSPQQAPQMVGIVLGMIVGALLFAWIMVRHHRRIIHFLGRQMGRVDWLAQRRYRLARKAVEFIRAVRILRHMTWRRRFTLYLVTIALWLPRYLVLPVVLWLIGRHVPLPYLFLVQALLNVGGDLILLPGGGGGIGVAFTALMSPYLSSQDVGFSLVAWRTYNFYWYLVVGGVIFLVKGGQAAHALFGGKKG